MTTFNDIQSGRCQGQKRIDLSCGLTEFPQSLFQYADDLEILNLSNNHLSALPNNLSDFKKLRVLFLSENDFTVFPEVLAKCSNLTMIGFKSCQIKSIAEQALPKGLRWLILTDNQLESLPQSIGGCANLQKLMLSGNKLRSLPHALSECSNLELLRISANQLETMPEWLFSMPKLSWLAFAGNPCVNQPHLADQPLTSVPWYTLHIKQELGSGASGIISQAAWQGEQDIAVKVFKGKVTSDGFPYDEKEAAIHAGDHDHLVQVLGQVSEHPEQKDGLILSLIPDSYQNLANPPSLTSCTRDIYHEDDKFSIHQVFKITLAIVGVATHLHQKQVKHGDLYAHNILINDVAHCLLGDFGAASIYTSLPPALHNCVERIEVRALGCLLEELLNITHQATTDSETALCNTLQNIKASCLHMDTKLRPQFSDIKKQMNVLKSHHSVFEVMI